MKRFTMLTLALAMSLLFLGGSASAQQQPGPGTTAITQPTVPQYPCDQHQTATSAGNGAAAVSFAAQIGKSFYVCSVYIVEVANAAVTGAAGPAPLFTSAGLQNALIWWGENGTLTTGQMKLITDENFNANPLKCLPNTIFSITNSGGQSTQSVRINVTGFYGPA